MTLNPGTVIAERYEIIDKIGSGGMANVYRAKDLELDRFVTFKVMKEEFVNDEEFKTRFKIEARSAASLSNQNIVSIFDVGQEGDIYYIVMEYINGVTLKDLILRRAPFDNDEVLGVATQIAAGLKHAHEHGIIHRDIKPQNILVTSTGIIKVTDFGIARVATAATVTTTGNTMGSVHYFAPEQARGGHVDFKSDIYCLGIVMYEMITGKLPFDGDTPVAIALKQISDPLPDIRAINPKASESVVKIIRKATEKLSRNRYQTTDELTNDLKRALTNQSGDFVKRAAATSASSVESETTISHPLSSNDTIAIDADEIKIIQEERASAHKKQIPREHKTNDDRYSLFDGKYKDFAQDGNEDKVNKKTERRVMIAAILTSIAIISVAIAILTSVLPGMITPVPQELEVPDILGWTLEQADVLATEMGIRINVVGNETSEEFAEGEILRQSVAGGGALYPGGAISVTLSLGDDRYEVPNLVNMDINEADNVIRESVFALDEEYVPSEDIAMNIVIDQYPPAGSMAHAGERIRVQISSGPSQSTAIVPNVVTFTEDRAITELQEARLVPSVVSRAENATVPLGSVISQTVEAGEEVSVYTTIGLVISEGPPNPDDEPEPTPTPTPTPTGTTPLPVTYILMPSPAEASIPDDVDVVNLRVTRIVGGVANLEYNENIPVAPFPFRLTRQGEGVADFLVEILHPVTGEMYHSFSHQIDFGS
ncbi:MAG: Stk1 family PASTA domain-containing Ser/Thr kinase [Defluviitaleaceae bacterium]|nr:Stk1 family PASTA domain-containing Ser/Thr kinase [Defluviitaleaceae bacterium]